jgi:hypothetical protein
VLLLDPATIQGALPAGFHWADASGLLGLPQPVGLGAAFFNAVKCPDGDTAETGLYVQAPHVAGLALEPALFDFYHLAFYTANQSLQQQMSAFGYPAFPTQVQASGTDLPAAATGMASVSSGATTAHSFAYTAASAGQIAGIGRFWGNATMGVGYVDYKISSPVFKGTLTACAIGAASPLGKAIGAISCQGQHPTAALRFPQQAWQGSIHLLPGVRAA